MSPSKRLQPVQRVAHSKEQKAARHMGESHKTLQEEQTKLAQLRQYHQEYLQRFDTAAKKGIGVNQLQEYRAFLSKLDTAIRQQEGIVATRKVDHNSKKNNWKETHTRSQALKNVVDRYQKQERKAADHNEQKESDDRSQRSTKN